MRKMYKPILVKIDEKTKQTEDEYLLRINHEIEHEQGQFLQLSILGFGEAPISICSYSEEYVELLIRNVGNVTNALCSLKKGDLIGIRGPYGRGYPIKLFKGDSIIMIGGGCGIAPMRSAIEYIERNREDFLDVHLFFGFKNPKEILFKEDMEKWREKFNLNLIVDKGDKKWKGNVGFVTDVLERADIDNKRKVVFICGPPAMIKFVIEILEKKGFNHDQIFISYERQMKCGVGICGHCMIHGKYVCKDGPVFRYDEVKGSNE